MSNEKVIIYKATNGKEYSSINEAIEDFKVSREKFDKRLHLGWSLKHCVETPEKVEFVRGEAFVDLHGLKFNRVADACKFYGLNPKLVHGRIDCGWDINEALELKPHIKTAKINKVTVLGVEFDTIKEACEKLGANYGKFRVTKTRFKCSNDEAVLWCLGYKEQVKQRQQLKTKEKELAKEITDDVHSKYSEIQKELTKIGMSGETLLKRLCAGMTVTEALSNG